MSRFRKWGLSIATMLRINIYMRLSDTNKNKREIKIKGSRYGFLNTVFICLSLLSDSNQRPRDYKSRALAN